VSAVWVVLLALAPSATWCAMPLLFAGLHALPQRLALPLAVVLTALVVVSEVRVADGRLNPNMVVAPPAVAAVATAVLIHLQRQGARQRLLIEDLVRTRHELAATERRAGVLAERQRLATEIHDTLAQGLSSQRMLLQAAERVWRTDPDSARAHLHDAAGITSRNLAEARRFVHDLAPADLAEHTLPDALAHLAERESGPGLTVEFRLDGDPDRLPERVEAALLRIAQGALANVREHAAATRAAVTLTFLDDQVSLDIADNGRGFDVADPGAGSAPHDREEPDRTRGHGLPAMCIRARQSGGTLTVESAPGEGTVVSAAVPLAPSAAARPSATVPSEEPVL
jgi:signal transduction histidine kinase